MFLVSWGWLYLVQVGAELIGGQEIERCEGFLANYRYRRVIMGWSLYWDSGTCSDVTLVPTSICLNFIISLHTPTPLPPVALRVAILELSVPIGSVKALSFLLPSVALISQNFLKTFYLIGTFLPQVTNILSFWSQATVGSSPRKPHNQIPPLPSCPPKDILPCVVEIFSMATKRPSC